MLVKFAKKNLNCCKFGIFLGVKFSLTLQVLPGYGAEKRLGIFLGVKFGLKILIRVKELTFYNSGHLGLRSGKHI